MSAIIRMKVNHMFAPVGISGKELTFSYTVDAPDACRQDAARVMVRCLPDKTLLYDSGMIENEWNEDGRLLSGVDPLAFQLPVTLAGQTDYEWAVLVRTDTGEEIQSEWAQFETGKERGEPWAGGFISSPLGQKTHPVFHRRFTVRAGLLRARAYCIGLGMYEPSLNGAPVTDEVLLPGFHTYDSRLDCQTLHLSPREGENELTFLLGNGWYKGRYGLKKDQPRYGNDFLLLCEVRLQYADGSEDIFGTDSSWTVTAAPVVFDGIYDGETVDSRIHGGVPRPALLSAHPTDLCGPRINPPVRIQKVLHPIRIPGTNILDFGQNLVGWMAFSCSAPAGTELVITTAEILKDGQMYRENLRKAQSTFRYIADGQAALVRPHFTFFGFRYLEVTGLPDGPDPDQFSALVIHSDMEETGEIVTGLPKVDRLIANAQWSQRGNFLDIPTDCPQRDERMGWTGDIQIFADTACFNADCTAFLMKYLADIRSEQARMDGNVPMVAPMSGYELPGTAAWGDAACILPWTLWLHSGDRQVLSRSISSMCAWVDWIHRRTEALGTGDLWRNDRQLGDWLALDGDSVYGGTDRDLIASAYYYHSACLTAKAAKVLGRDDLRETYDSLARRILTAFQKRWFTADGLLTSDTQTAYALCLAFGLVPEQALPRIRSRLVRKVIERQCRLSTGFVGTPVLLPSLVQSGHPELAYQLLLREDYPGWLYEINRGATTIWERWNSIEPDGEMNRDGMNSFNHYAYGSVVGWMYRTMGGIIPEEGGAGLRCVTLQPLPDRRFPHVRVRVMSPSGPYETEWTWSGDQVHLRLEIPFGCTAHAVLPGMDHPITLRTGIHTFDCSIPRIPVDGIHHALDELMEIPETRAVLAERFPKALRGGVAFQREMVTLAQLLDSPFAEMDDLAIAELDAELRAVQQRLAQKKSAN